MKLGLAKARMIFLAMLALVLVISFNNCNPIKFQNEGGSTTMPNPEPTDFSNAVKATLAISNAFCGKHVEAGLIQAIERENCYSSFLGDLRPLDMFCDDCDSTTIAAMAASQPSDIEKIIFDQEQAMSCYSAILSDSRASEYSVNRDESFSFEYLRDLVSQNQVCSDFIQQEFPEETVLPPPPPAACEPSFPTDLVDFTDGITSRWPDGGGFVPYTIGLGQTLAIRFKLQPAQISGFGLFWGAAGVGDGNGIRQITLSEVEGCVDATQVPASCTSVGREAGIRWSIAQERPGHCVIQPDTTYYLNVTYGDSSSCSAGQPCCPTSDGLCTSHLGNEPEQVSGKGPSQ